MNFGPRNFRSGLSVQGILGADFRPGQIFFDGKIETPSLSHSFSTGPKVRAEISASQ